MCKKLKANRRYITGVLLVFAVITGSLLWKTYADFLALPESLAPGVAELSKVQIVDRNHVPLTVTYQNRWNAHDFLPLHEIPELLQQAFVMSEDQRFYRHGGVDWTARLHALWQNLTAWRAIRGASTISEQVVRMWHPRPRTAWSRWLEGLEAARLEKCFSKVEILEFYLNQVPFAGQRRGVVQAARYFFDRDPDTLNTSQMLALVVMVRAPSRLNIRRNPAGLMRPIRQLADRLVKYNVINIDRYASIADTDLQIKTAESPVRADHFVRYLYHQALPPGVREKGRLRTTLDAALQLRVQRILDHRIKDLSERGVRNGAVLIVNHQHPEVLAWVNSGAGLNDVPASWIDAVITPRQPGSTLKPLLYALALEKGWTAATLVNDKPLSEPVGRGLHSYHNYSRVHYGPIRVREALGNSLNIPAVRAIQFVGVNDFLECLKRMDVRSLHQHPDFYGDGLALGNGEVTLLELVRIYTVLARQGVYHPLNLLMSQKPRQEETRRIFSPETTSLIGNILSDPEARRLEFGHGSLLRFPVQTAVKTGTSNDYRDAWAIGFNYRYTVGVWIGNLDHQATDGITGSNGPALILRSVFAELNQHQNTRPLYLSPRLVNTEICRDSGLAADDRCIRLSEWFVPGTVPQKQALPQAYTKPVYLQHPTQGMQLAMDPRIPEDQQAFVFKLANLPKGIPVDWYVDKKLVASLTTGQYPWTLKPGKHSVQARIWTGNLNRFRETAEVNFFVK